MAPEERVLIMEWYLAVLKNYVGFEGRARRKEFWMFTLVNFIVYIVLNILSSFIGILAVLGFLYSLGTLLPSLAVSVRRLHDTGRCGWWVLIGFVPLIGWLVMLYFCVLDSQPGANEYGPNPKEDGQAPTPDAAA